MQDIIEKVNVLIEALPYMRTFFGKTFVIKYGGNAMVNEELKKSVITDIVLLKYIGINPVVVHGGGPEITQMLKRLGKEAKFVQGLRVTDKETMEIVEMVLVGKINKEIVSMINKLGGKAVGLSGKDGNLIVANKMILPDSDDTNSEENDLGFVGDIVGINPEMINILNKEGYIPVISGIGVGYDGESYNINADHVAGELAGALGADKLIMLTDVEGIYEDYNDKDSLVSSLSLGEARKMVENGTIDGGMIPKVEACIKAVEAGVQRTHIVDGRMIHSMLLEIFTDKGIGTMVVR